MHATIARGLIGLSLADPARHRSALAETITYKAD